MIFVDELVPYHAPTTGPAAQHFGGGKPSCHLTTDGPDAELHAFAAAIGLRRAWFQPGPPAHYDLTPGKRAAALTAGAVFVPARDQARTRLAARRAARGT